MFPLLVALTLYLALVPVQPALSVADYRPPAPVVAGNLPLAAARRDMPVLTPAKKDRQRLGLEVAAKSAVVIDWRTGSPLFEKNADVSLPLASLTKLLTALVVLDERIDWGAPVEFTAADQMAGDLPILLPGERVTVKDLFNLSLIASSNDATAALARSTGLSAAGFVGKMNAKAAAIGLNHYVFVEPTGLDPKNEASARDAAVLIRRALDQPAIRATVASRVYEFTALTGAAHRVRSTDQLLDSFLSRPPYEFLGGKTGFLDEAGYCFGAAAGNGDGNRVVAVVLGAANIDDRFREVKRLIYWAFDAYAWPAAAGVKS